MFRYKSIEDFTEVADTHLQAEFEHSSLSRRLSFEVFDRLPLDSEADIVVASQLYLLPPLMYVLQESSEDMWTIKSELPKTLASKKTIRYDLVFRTCSTHHNPNTMFAIIEYKQLGMIRYEDISGAILEEDATDQDIAYQKSEATELKLNGLTYLKQASTYARESGCQHVAIFNWEHLVLFDFYKMSRSGKSFTAGDEARISWVTEAKECPDLVYRMEHGYIRKVLLGWLLEAYDQV